MRSGRSHAVGPACYAGQMGEIEIGAERVVGAPAEVVYRCIAGMQEHHHRFLPPAFSGFEVESGGVGASSIVRHHLSAGGRNRAFRMVVAEPEPGRVLTESDANSSLVTTFTVDAENGAARVRISTTWDGAGGIGGFFERRFAPRAMHALYLDELERLEAYARAQTASPPAP